MSPESSAEPRIVLDTNVLRAGLHSSKGASHRVLWAIARGRIKIAVSTALLFEYEEILTRQRVALRLAENDVQSILDNICR